MTTRLNRLQRDRQFGRPGKIDRELVSTPWGIRTQVHAVIADRFALACHLAHERSTWRPQRIDGYNNRPIRDFFVPSMHAYALAWDFFATPHGIEPPGGVWTPDDAPDLFFYEPWLQLGFQLGALFTRRKDLPHIEWAGSIDDAPVRWSALG